MNGLLTTAEVRTILKVSNKTLLKYIHTGQLKSSNIGTGSRPRYRIRRDDLGTFLEERTASTGEK